MFTLGASYHLSIYHLSIVYRVLYIDMFQFSVAAIEAAIRIRGHGLVYFKRFNSRSIAHLEIQK